MWTTSTGIPSSMAGVGESPTGRIRASMLKVRRGAYGMDCASQPDEAINGGSGVTHAHADRCGLQAHDILRAAI